MAIDTDPAVLDHKLRALARSCRELRMDARKNGSVVVIHATMYFDYVIGADDGRWTWIYCERYGDQATYRNGTLHTPIMGATTDAAREMVDVIAGRQD